MGTSLFIGKSASVTAAVTEADTAISAGSGELPVFATPMMIELMERAACKCLADVLTEGQTSVGTRITAEHSSASPIGAVITATAIVERAGGRSVEFSVTADEIFPGEKQIGKGEHTRVIVDVLRFMSKLNGEKL